MKNIVAFYCFFTFTAVVFGQPQFALIDKKMNAISTSSTVSTTLIAKYINSNFNTENDKIRAVFYWIATNIRYDIDNMYAINFNETAEDKINTSKAYFDFEKELANLDKLSELEKLKQSLARIEKNGIKNGLIFDRVANKKSQIENFAIEDFNKIVNLYNQSIVEFNTFIDFRNNQFKPTKPDNEIDEMIQNPLNKLKQCQDLLNNLGQINEPNLSQVNIIKNSITTMLDQIKEQEKFVKDYLSKAKFARKSMFSKVSWFGIPLN